MYERISNKILVVAIFFIYLFIAIFCFFVFGLSRVDAATKYVIYDNYNVVTEYASSDSVYVEKYFDNGSTNHIGFSIITSYVLKKGETYNFDVSFSLSVTSQNAIVSCNNWKSDGRVLIGDRKGSIQTLKNSNFTQSSCINASLINNPSTATYNFKGSFIASDNNNYITFAFPFNTDYSLDSGRALTFRYSNFYFTVNSEGSTNDDIINNNNQNSQNIINNQTQNKNDIINNQDKNTNDIIDNQNKNNQEIKDSLNDGFNKCYTSKNLLPTNKNSYTLNGVTVTNNDDGTYTLNGTTTAISKFFFYQGDSITLPSGTYTGSSFSKRMVFIRMNSAEYQGLSTAKLNSITFTLDASFTFNNLYLYTDKGVTFNNEVIKPMLIKGSSIGSFEKYGEICTNRQDETNNKLDDLNDNITNSDVDSSAIDGFFGNFKDTDHKGISGIITAPLIAINQMLNGSCSALTFTYKGKNVEIPSGCSMWSRIPEVKDFLNVIEGGFLCYLIIRKMYYLVNRLKNPDDDRVEVMAL